MPSQEEYDGQQFTGLQSQSAGGFQSYAPAMGMNSVNVGLANQIPTQTQTLMMIQNQNQLLLFTFKSPLCPTPSQPDHSYHHLILVLICGNLPDFVVCLSFSVSVNQTHLQTENLN